MFRILYLLLLGVLCSSCAMNNKNGAIDLTKLQNSDQKYGIIVFRSMFFPGSPGKAEDFALNEYIELNNSNDADISAQQYNANIKYVIGGSYPSNYDEEKQKKFSNSINQITLMPEYFYTVKMLPEGEYYVNRTMFGSFDRFFDKSNSPYYFYVNANKINYLGDLYFFTPKDNAALWGGLWSTTYDASIALIDKSAKAQEFMQQYYPEIKLPLITNMIKLTGNGN